MTGEPAHNLYDLDTPLKQHPPAWPGDACFVLAFWGEGCQPTSSPMAAFTKVSL